LRSPHELSWLVDITELFLRFVLDDWERAEELLRRLPRIEMVRQIDLNAKFQSDPKKIPALVEAFPENTPREKVNKFLYQATINVESENIALGYLNKALEVGAEVGLEAIGAGFDATGILAPLGALVGLLGGLGGLFGLEKHDSAPAPPPPPPVLNASTNFGT